jgi:error-prone DNA polymerase
MIIPVQHLRPVLDDHDLVPIGQLGAAYAERRVQVARMVTHRSALPPQVGVTFLNLEDETGMLNVVSSAELWRRFGRIGPNASA